MAFNFDPRPVGGASVAGIGATLRPRRRRFRRASAQDAPRRRPERVKLLRERAFGLVALALARGQQLGRPHAPALFERSHEAAHHALPVDGAGSTERPAASERDAHRFAARDAQDGRAGVHGRPQVAVAPKRRASRCDGPKATSDTGARALLRRDAPSRVNGRPAPR